MQTNGLVCRDYLRNVCQRTNGDCRFEHPPRIVSNAVQSRDPSQSNQSMNPNRNPDMNFQQDKVSVCRDFARGSCPRTHCRFLHLTPSEVRDYATNGNLPERILVARSNGLKMQSADVEALNGAIPLCRDYLKGICLRRETCRYLHLNNISAPLSPSPRSSSNHSLHSSSNARFEQDLDESPPLIKRMKATSSGVFEIQSPDEPLQPHHTPNETFHSVPSGRVSANRHNAPNNSSGGHMVGSRRRRSSVSGLSPAGDHYDPFSNSPPFPSPSGSTTSGGSSAGGHSRSLSNRRRITNSNSNRPCSTCLGCNNLQVENRSLRLKVIELEKQVNNLSTTNDVLLTQNAKLRTNKVVPFQNTANPQQQQNQQQQQQPVNPPIQPVQQPTPVSIHCGYPSVAVTNSNSINNNNLSIPNFGMNYGSQSNEAPPPPPPVIVQNNMGGYNTNINSTFNANGEHHTNNSTPLPAQNHIQTRNVLQPQQHLQTAIQVPNGAAVGAVHLTTHPRNPNATTVANVNAAVPYFITQLTPNFTPLNGTHAAAASLNPSAVQSAAQAVAAAPSGSIRAAILPHPANQVVAAAQPVAIAGSGHYTPTFLLPHVPTTTVNPVSANSANPQQLTVTTLSLTPLAAAAGYTGQLYNLRPASGTTYHLTPASAQTVCINALQAAPNMSPVVVAHTPSTLAAAAAQSVGSGATAVFQTVQAIQASSRISSPHN